MKYLFMILLLLYPFMQSSSQNRYGCKQIALSNSDIAVKSNPFALFYNPGILIKNKNFELNIFHSPAPFGMKELSTSCGALTLNSSLGTLGVGYTNFGFELFREQKIAISYANTINKIFSVGISAIYHNVSIKNYGTDNSFILLVGGVFDMTSNINFAFSVYNPNRATYGNENNQLPVILNFGTSYKITDNAQICFTNSKELDQENSLRFGFIFLPIEWIEIQTGYTTYPESFSAGFSFSKLGCSIEYATFSHTDLGFTHQFGINLIFDE